MNYFMLVFDLFSVSVSISMAVFEPDSYCTVQRRRCLEGCNQEKRQQKNTDRKFGRNIQYPVRTQYDFPYKTSNSDFTVFVSVFLVPAFWEVTLSSIVCIATANENWMMMRSENPVYSCVLDYVFTLRNSAKVYLETIF